MSGNKDDKYMINPKNHNIFLVNTICNYDTDIIPYLNSDIGSTYIIVDGNKEVLVEKQK